jgi:serine/threonine protein phosphatase PrpC
VSDEEIARKIADNPRSEDVCKSLLDLALDRGGSDNITIVVVRRRIATPPTGTAAVLG